MAEVVLDAESKRQALEAAGFTTEIRQPPTLPPQAILSQFTQGYFPQAHILDGIPHDMLRSVIQHRDARLSG